VTATVGVLVMAYGTPARPDDITEYYTHIRRGRPPSEEQLRDLAARYEAIGGTSPLRRRTEEQRARLASALESRRPGEFVTALGMKHSEPFIEDGAAELAKAGVEEIVGLVLAPHYSRGSVGEYLERLERAAGDLGVRVSPVRSWHLRPELIEFLTSAARAALAGMPATTKLVFTAHSLPERVLVGDPYVDQLRESAELVARGLGLNRWAGWGLAWQSAGRTPERWRGPDIDDVIDDLAATGRSEGIVVCPQGFTADHLEVLYDLDIAARRRAEERGLAFARTRSLNDDPQVFSGLADLVIATADSALPADL
jgi:protoporphyrin/coproporphyrin ferrochelatase